MATALTTTKNLLPDLELISTGKVRDIYATSDPNALLFIATDRISAYDVILNNGIPDKGKILTRISLFWFKKLGHIIPNHLITADPSAMPPDVSKYTQILEGRSMLVKKADVIPLEAIVRGYLSGSAWVEYKKTGTVHGIPLPSGMLESEKLPEPIFTPSTKAAQGDHDENISPAQAALLVGPELYEEISTVSLALYKSAATHALSRGIILADTKFEFGLLSPEGSLILIDEVLTPDSSRYWPADDFAVGRPQSSFDKQYVRDWLVSAGFAKGLEAGKEGAGWTVEEDVIRGTRMRYAEAERLLVEDSDLDEQ